MTKKLLLLLTAALIAAPAAAQDLGAPVGEDQPVESIAVEGEASDGPLRGTVTDESG